MKFTRKIVTSTITTALLATCATACTSRPAPSPLVESEPILIAPQQQAEGTADYIWEEPMVDVVDVPPGLDPEGQYYRPGHQEILEIRQGRWKYYRGDQESAPAK